MTIDSASRLSSWRRLCGCGLLILAGGCAAGVEKPPPTPKAPCRIELTEAQPAQLEVRVSDGVLGLIDGRPYVVSAEGGIRGPHFESLPCAHDRLLLRPGPHTVHLFFKVAGSSVMVESSYAAMACHFEVKPGRDYLLEHKPRLFPAMGPDRFSCKVFERTPNGRSLVARDTACLEAHFGGCGREEYARTLMANLELARAFASCGRPESRRVMEAIRAKGVIGARAKDYELGPCNPFFDLRARGAFSPAPRSGGR